MPWRRISCGIKLSILMMLPSRALLHKRRIKCRCKSKLFFGLSPACQSRFAHRRFDGFWRASGICCGPAIRLGKKKQLMTRFRWFQSRNLLLHQRQETTNFVRISVLARFGSFQNTKQENEGKFSRGKFASQGKSHQQKCVSKNV
jgi:hypothetical protein